MQRHDVASTLRRRCINVMCLLGLKILSSVRPSVTSYKIYASVFEEATADYMTPNCHSVSCFEEFSGIALRRVHYENMPIQIKWKFYHHKLKIFRLKKFWYFSYFCSKRRGGSNEYPQSMFWAGIRKIMHTPVNPSVTIQKWGLRGSELYYIGMFSWWSSTVLAIWAKTK